MNLVEEARKYAIDEIKEFGSPSLPLFELSEKTAISLAKRLNANTEIVLAGTYLMDINHGRAKKKNKLSEHVKMSVDATKKFLTKFNLGEETKGKIINCVGAHHGEIPFNCIEAEICANADCYKFIHPKGFFNALITLNKNFSEFPKLIDFLEKKLDEKYKILSLDICKEELDGYYKSLKELIKKTRE